MDESGCGKQTGPKQKDVDVEDAVSSNGAQLSCSAAEIPGAE